MRPRNLRAPRWRRVEQNALEMLYLAGWSWAAASVHISALGTYRGPDACRCEAHRLMVSAGKSRGRPRHHDTVGDIEDMMILGWSTREMAADLGLPQATVQRLTKRVSVSLRRSWLNRASERLSRGSTKGWRTKKRGATREKRKA